MIFGARFDDHGLFITTFRSVFQKSVSLSVYYGDILITFTNFNEFIAQM